MRGVTKLALRFGNSSGFQLTRLMRGVTCKRRLQARISEIISTHTPHARRDKKAGGRLPILTISTHTPHARRDAKTTSNL